MLKEIPNRLCCINFNIVILSTDRQDVHETGDEAKFDCQDAEDDNDEDIVDVQMPMAGAAKGGGRGKRRKKTRGGRARDRLARAKQS